MRNTTAFLALFWYFYDEWLAEITTWSPLGEIPFAIWIAVALSASIAATIQNIVAGTVIAKNK